MFKIGKKDEKDIFDAIGRHGKGKISGIEGTIIGVGLYLTGCNMIAIKPKSADGVTNPKGVWIDEETVVISGEKIELDDVEIMKPEIELGSKVKDTISGFTGVAIGYCTYISGKDEYGVTPKAKDGKEAETAWFHSKHVEEIKPKVIKKEEVQGKRKGGPRSCAPTI